MPAATWRIVAASVRGAGHEKTGQPCQDAVCHQIGPGGWLVAAVADGAGTARLGDAGAQAAVRAAVDATIRRWPAADFDREAGISDDDLWRRSLVAAVEEARSAVEIEAARCDAEVRDLASTLIVLVAGPSIVAAAQIGDGAAVVADATGELTALTKPDAGEYLNETVFLVTPGAATRLQTIVWHGVAAHLAAFSDGLQLLALKMPAGTPHAPFFGPLFQFAAQAGETASAEAELERFLQSANVRGRTDDDVTLLLGTCLAAN